MINAYRLYTCNLNTLYAWLRHSRLVYSKTRENPLTRNGCAGSSPAGATTLIYIIMYTKEEVSQDMDKLRDHVDALRLKYGEDFSSVIVAGTVIDDYWVGACMVGGQSPGLHQICHALLGCVKFIDEFFNACKCVLHDDEKPELLQDLEKANLESLKRMLIVRTKEYEKAKAELDAEESVKQFLHDAGFAN